jgi:ribosomal protein L29
LNHPRRIDPTDLKLATFYVQLLTRMSKSSGKVKAGQLWSKNKDELTKQLGELKTELGQLRIQKIVSSGTKLTKMYVDSNPSAPAAHLRRRTRSRGMGVAFGLTYRFFSRIATTSASRSPVSLPSSMRSNVLSSASSTRTRSTCLLTSGPSRPAPSVAACPPRTPRGFWRRPRSAKPTSLSGSSPSRYDRFGGRATHRNRQAVL